MVIRICSLDGKFYFLFLTTDNYFYFDIFGGGEDDDHHFRIVSKGFKILHPPQPYGRYLMMGHTPDEPNPKRYVFYFIMWI